MASSAVVSALPSPLRDLVVSTSPCEGTRHDSGTEKNNLVSNYLTAAGVASLYGVLYPTFMSHTNIVLYYYLHFAVTRYLDHIQTQPSVRRAADALAPVFAFVTFDPDYVPMPKMQRKAELPKKKEKAQKSPGSEEEKEGANMRGIKDFAMVHCAISKDGKETGIELVQSPPGSKPGDRVYFEGETFINTTPLSQLNPKKKIFETIQPDPYLQQSKEAAWVDPVTKSVHKIRTANDVCVATTLIGASLS
ncbi:hypothetical protein ACEPAG_1776 [Sanghuangporus baumii]